MRAIIAGSRTCTNYEDMLHAITASGWADQITEVVCGMASGADILGHRWAKSRSIPITEMPADWDTYGRKAGYKRNWQMADYAGPDAVVIILWDGVSTGSRAMRNIARMRGMQTFVYIPSGTEAIEI
jgi:hypothetical protein